MKLTVKLLMALTIISLFAGCSLFKAKKTETKPTMTKQQDAKPAPATTKKRTVK